MAMQKVVKRDNIRIFIVFPPWQKYIVCILITAEKGGLPSGAQKGRPSFRYSYSIVILLPEASFFGSSFGISTVRTPDSYLAFTSSGLTSPT